MAKSIRSKWKRKCRAVKRERYGKKELDRLKKTLGIDESQSDVKDVKMIEISEVANVVDAKAVKKTKSSADQMDVEPDKKDFNPKTLRNRHGAYPIWLHPRKMTKSKVKKKKGKKGKKSKH